MTLFFSAAFLSGGMLYLLTNHWIDISVLEKYDPGRPSIVLDMDGNEWARFEYQKREPLAIQEMPNHLLEAFLSAEDWDFYSHSGISWKGIVRSLLVNMYYGKKMQGASTITQQLVKLLFFDLKKTFSRKIKEQLYAVIIEQQCSKQHILEVYLNHIYFGCGLYGVEAAAQAFWGISARNVSIEQAATLAGIIRTPSYFCPLLHPKAAKCRRDIVLYSMLKRCVITETQYKNALNIALILKESKDTAMAHHLKEYVRIFLEKKLGKKELYTGGYIIQTTINQKMQCIAQKEFQKQVVYLKNELKKPVDGAVLSFEVQTGALRAIVGGIDFKQSSFNRAFQAKRQLGSIFKPIVYAAAIEQGKKLSDVLIDEPLEIKDAGHTWAPNNFNKKFNGAITRAYALSRSNNIVTIKTLLEVGIDAVIDVARRCHVPGPFNQFPSLALGCIDGTLLQAASMMNVFANDGIYVEPYVIDWVKDRTSKKIYKHTPICERAIQSPVASQVAKVLMHGVQRAHKRFSQKWLKGEAMSKTGTTNDSRTCWYIGSTPTLTTAVYIGCDNNQSMGKNIYPVRTAFPIWLGINHKVDSLIKNFTFDSSLQEVCIDECTGKRISKDHERAIEILV